MPNMLFRTQRPTIIPMPAAEVPPLERMISAGQITVDDELTFDAFFAPPGAYFLRTDRRWFGLNVGEFAAACHDADVRLDAMGVNGHFPRGLDS